MENIILIKKYTEGCFFWHNLLRKKQIANLSMNQVLNKYQGFEGELIFHHFQLKRLAKIYLKKPVNLAMCI